ITVRDTNGLQLGNVTATGPLSVMAGGALTELAGTVGVESRPTLSGAGFPITLANAANDFDIGGASLTATGAAITVRDTNGLQLEIGRASGREWVMAGGGGGPLGGKRRGGGGTRVWGCGVEVRLGAAVK